MGQYESLKNGLQGNTLTQGHYDYKGVSPDLRKGAIASDDLHYVDGEHVHSDPTLPFAGGEAGLASRALTLQGSRYNNNNPYKVIEPIQD